MPPSNSQHPLLFQLSELLPKKSDHHHATKPPIRKRHWALGSLVILVGSWITHSTTATIKESSDEATVSEVELSAPLFSNSPMLELVNLTAPNSDAPQPQYSPLSFAAAPSTDVSMEPIELVPAPIEALNHHSRTEKKDLI